LLRSTAFLHGETGREILIPSPLELNKPLEPRKRTWFRKSKIVSSSLQICQKKRQ